jgi:uncharacterized FlgJ-related protein
MSHGHLASLVRKSIIISIDAGEKKKVLDKIQPVMTKAHKKLETEGNYLHIIIKAIHEKSIANITFSYERLRVFLKDQE